GHAIQEAYRGLLMTGRYAISFLFLEMPADLVDVNVHPTKAEVRFRDSQSLFHLVLTTIRSRLTEANLVPKLQAPQLISEFSSSEFGIRISELTPNDASTVDAGGSGQNYPVLQAQSYDPQVFDSESEEKNVTGNSSIPNSEFRVPNSNAAASSLAKVFQLHNAYIVLETSDGMLVIDQHALHERILFEQLKNRWRGGQLEKQKLLIPEPVDLAAEQA